MFDTYSYCYCSIRILLLLPPTDTLRLQILLLGMSTTPRHPRTFSFWAWQYTSSFAFSERKRNPLAPACTSSYPLARIGRSWNKRDSCPSLPSVGYTEMKQWRRLVVGRSRSGERAGESGEKGEWGKAGERE